MNRHLFGPVTLGTPSRNLGEVEAEANCLSGGRLREQAKCWPIDLQHGSRARHRAMGAVASTRLPEVVSRRKLLELPPTEIVMFARMGSGWLPNRRRGDPHIDNLYSVRKRFSRCGRLVFGGPISGKAMLGRRTLSVLLIAAATIAFTSVAGYSAFFFSNRDIEVVEPHVALRSGRLDRYALEAAVHREGIRSVVDVGPERAAAAEMSIIEGFGLRYVRMPLGHDGRVSVSRMSAFVEMLEHMPQPLLIRSSEGIGGTRLAAALTKLSVAGGTVEDASRPLSRGYGGLPFLDAEADASETSFREFVVHRQGMENHVVAP